MKVEEFGKGSTLAAETKKNKKDAGVKAIIKKWLPVILLVVGIGLIFYGLVVELGALC